MLQLEAFKGLVVDLLSKYYMNETVRKSLQTLTTTLIAFVVKLEARLITPVISFKCFVSTPHF